jgi:acyl carrier protein
MTADCIRNRVRDFILANFVFEENSHVGEDQSLLRSGVLDSTGILELIAFVQKEFHLELDDSELVADNFDTINRVTEFVLRKNQEHTLRMQEDAYTEPS